MSDEKKHIFDNPKNVKRVIALLFGACAVLLLLDVIPYKAHLHYGVEGWFGFYGVYGFVGCVILVLVAKEMRKVLMREEDYYDR